MPRSSCSSASSASSEQAQADLDAQRARRAQLRGGARRAPRRAPAAERRRSAPAAPGPSSTAGSAGRRPVRAQLVFGAQPVLLVAAALGAVCDLVCARRDLVVQRRSLRSLHRLACTGHRGLGRGDLGGGLPWGSAEAQTWRGRTPVAPPYTCPKEAVFRLMCRRFVGSGSGRVPPPASPRRRAGGRGAPFLAGVRRPPKRVAGIEPASSAWKAEALPLSYTRRAAPASRTIAEPACILNAFPGGEAARAYSCDMAGGTVLVVGASGYVGRRLVPALLDAGLPVRALVRDPARVSLPRPPRR